LNRTALTCTALASLSILGAAVLIAGPIDPPSGAVGPTYKTLAEVEPRIAISPANTPGDLDSLFKITQPGSYYLTANITGVPSRHGIEIASRGVTLDLNGFHLTGIAGMGVFDGVTVTVTNVSDIVVLNGSVRDWGGDGVDLAATGASNCRVERVNSSANAGVGIALSGPSRMSECAAWDNGSDGLVVGSNSTVIDCTSLSNGGAGIVAGIGSVVSLCAVKFNVGDGIDADPACTITACAAHSNFSNGFALGSSCLVADCTSNGNALDGILISSGSVVRGNNCVGNGFNDDAAGIHATGSRNRIEANACTSNDRGIDVDGPSNVIIRNTCSANTQNNWDVVAGNVILVVNATPAALVTGNNGGVAPGSTDPNANFTH